MKHQPQRKAHRRDHSQRKRVSELILKFRLARDDRRLNWKSVPDSDFMIHVVPTSSA